MWSADVDRVAGVVGSTTVDGIGGDATGAPLFPGAGAGAGNVAAGVAGSPLVGVALAAAFEGGGDGGVDD